MNRLSVFLLAVLILSVCQVHGIGADAPKKLAKQFTVYPIGWVRKADGRTTIVVDKKYQPALLGLEQFSHVWVLYWFDRNDTPEKRSILQVHPGGNPDNPIRGVFATHIKEGAIAAMLCHDMICVGDGKPVAHFGAALWSGAEGGLAADKEGLETARNLGRRVAEIAKRVRP